MSRSHLFLVTLGPVQAFIDQARRTRDLWSGSELLSALSEEIVKVIAASDGELVFPSPTSAPSAPRRGTKESGGLSNKILAWVANPEATARDVRSRVAAELAERGRKVKASHGEILAGNIDEAWDEQLATFAEVLCAWTRPASRDGFSAARRELDRAIASRKRLRDFSPWLQQRGSVPKSSLDGARDTVLFGDRDTKDESRKKAFAKLRIPPGEQLDAIGLIKRARPTPSHFVPITNVALGPWLAAATERAPDELVEVEAACRENSVGPIKRDGHWSKFPWDAQVLLPGRWESLGKELDLGPSAKEWGRDHVGPFLRAVGRDPYPYVACLVADGDGVGKRLNWLTSQPAFVDFSNRLASFASQAKAVIESKHRGILIYAGGDDVLAFLPLQDAVGAAAELRACFMKLMSARPNGFEGDWDPPTLSIGIGIGHVLESLGHLRGLGGEAERLAKGGHLPYEQRRNALALVVDKRSGGKCEWRGSWADNVSPTDRLHAALEFATGDGLATRKVYEIQRDRARLPTVDQIGRDREAQHRWVRLIATDLARTIGRADRSAHTNGPQRDEAEVKVQPDDVGLDLLSGHLDQLLESIDGWLALMKIAFVLRAAVRSLPEKAANEGGAA